MGSAEEEVPEISLSPLFCSFVEAPDKPVSTGGGHAPWGRMGEACFPFSAHFHHLC